MINTLLTRLIMYYNVQATEKVTKRQVTAVTGLLYTL